MRNGIREKVINIRLMKNENVKRRQNNGKYVVKGEKEIESERERERERERIKVSFLNTRKYKWEREKQKDYIG